MISLFRTSLFSALVAILYFTTTAIEYELAQSANDKLLHALAFLILSFLADFSFPRIKFSMTKIYPLAAYGVLIECIQYFLPYRSFSLLDILADVTGIVSYLLLSPVIIQLPLLRQARMMQ